MAGLRSGGSIISQMARPMARGFVKPKTSRHPEDHSSGWRVFVGGIIHSPTEYEPFKAYMPGIVGTKDDKIVFTEFDSSGFIDDPKERLQTLMAVHGFPLECVYGIEKGEFLMPGLVDGRINAAQYPNIGTGVDLPTMQWLYTYNFQVESRFDDAILCETTFKKLVTKTLRAGTTTASYVTSIHPLSGYKLADTAINFGQRCFIAKSCMDKSGVSYYNESMASSIDGAKAVINYIDNKKNPAVLPMASCRGAHACSKELMSGLSTVSRDFRVPLSTFISGEQLEGFSQNFLQIYKDCQVLSPSTHFYSGVGLKPTDLKTLSMNECGLIHCPNSNINTSTGLSNCRQYLDADLKIGLGTDIASGWSYSMLDAIRCTAQVSKLIGLVSDTDPLYHKELLMLSTIGAAKTLGLQNKVGNFVPGKQFDALLVNTKITHGPMDSLPTDSLEELFQRFLYSGDDRNIKDVYVAGKHVVSHG